MGSNPHWCNFPIQIGSITICQPLAITISLAIDIVFTWQFRRQKGNDIFKKPWIFLFIGYMIMSTSAILQRITFPCTWKQLSKGLGSLWGMVLWEFLMIGGYYMVAQFGVAGALNDLGWINWENRQTRLFNYYILVALASYQMCMELLQVTPTQHALLFAIPFMAVILGILFINILLVVHVCRSRINAHWKLYVSLFLLSAFNVFGILSFLWGGNECTYYIIEALCTMALWWYVLEADVMAKKVASEKLLEEQATVETGSPMAGVAINQNERETELQQKYGRKFKMIENDFVEKMCVYGDTNKNVPKIDLSNPRSYKGGRIDPFTTFCDKNFRKLAYFLPPYLSPNLLTIAGLVISFIGELPAAIHVWEGYFKSADGLGEQFFVLPRYMYVLIVLGVEADWMLDAMDGEYARITGQQSCARHVFDHMTDVLQRIFTPIICTPLLPIRDMPLAYFIPVLTFMSEMALFIPFLRYYVTGQFNLCLGLRLTSHSINLYFLISAIAGGDLWTHSGAFTVFCVWFGIVFLIVVFEICEHLYACWNSNFSMKQLLELVLTPLMIADLVAFTFAVGLAKTEPLGVSFVVGIVFCTYTNHIMTQQHMQRTPAIFPLELWVAWIGLILASIAPRSIRWAMVVSLGFALLCSYFMTTHLLLQELKTLDNGFTFTIFRKRLATIGQESDDIIRMRTSKDKRPPSISATKEDLTTPFNGR